MWVYFMLMFDLILFEDPRRQKSSGSFRACAQDRKEKRIPQLGTGESWVSIFLDVLPFYDFPENFFFESLEKVIFWLF